MKYRSHFGRVLCPAVSLALLAALLIVVSPARAEEQPAASSEVTPPAAGEAVAVPEATPAEAAPVAESPPAEPTAAAPEATPTEPEGHAADAEASTEGHAAAEAEGGEGHGEGEGGVEWQPSKISVLGFVAMLLAIAVIPLASPHWWEHNKNKAIISGVLSVIMGAYVLMNVPFELVKSMHEYEQFLILLAALFIISSGIWVSGDIRATPKNNTFFIALGALLASFIGTTGASMVLIRPLLTSNFERKRVVHTVIFFIFLVSNIGGSLTPLGDPPLFLGYLRGVPFTWTFFAMFKIWAPTVIFLLIIYFILDTYIWKKEPPECKAWDAANIIPVKIKGLHNVIFLFGVILSIYFYPKMYETMIAMGISEHTAEYIPVREVLMILMAALSWFTTKDEYRTSQNFTWNPIIEVAVLFFGIFVTMIPTLIILNQWGPTAPVQQPWHFFWATGVLSSFLDNAPTYLTFLSLGTGQPIPEGFTSVALHGGKQINEISLLAISVGAVFMGANTYIGNAPNFMVKSIAEENKVKMPSFFGYMAWSVGILVPTFILITLIFFT